MGTPAFADGRAFKLPWDCIYLSRSELSGNIEGGQTADNDSIRTALMKPFWCRSLFLISGAFTMSKRENLRSGAVLQKRENFTVMHSIISCYVWFLVVDWRDKQLCLRGGTSFKVPSAPISYFSFREELSHISRDRQWPCRSCWWYISFSFPRMLMCLTKKKKDLPTSQVFDLPKKTSLTRNFIYLISGYYIF